MGSCMRALESNDLISEIKLSSESKPFLGICLGLQLLFGYSEENNGTNGLSIVPGDVVKFNNTDLKIPHMGWNNVNQVKNHPLWYKIDNNSRFYSVHSYYVNPTDTSCVVGTTEYGQLFASAIAIDKIFAVQFHPEKSKSDGLQLLRNFVEWA